MKILIVDCYDSFTYNLCQQVGRLGCEITVIRNDVSVTDIPHRDFDRIILSPGPGGPAETGICPELIDTLCRDIPTLGVCLGHQVICHCFGAAIEPSGNPVHGKTSLIHHDGRGIYTGLENPVSAMRYHSLIIREESLPEELAITARSIEDKHIMGVRHVRYPIEGVMFHPESILTPAGDQLIENFIHKGVCR